MKFGVALPNAREGLHYPAPFAPAEKLIDLAVKAEEVGFDSVWVNDHYLAPAYVRQQFSKPSNLYDPLVTLAAVAASTKRIRIGVCILVLPLRDPIVLAKQAATLDALSNGRFTLGLGMGAFKEEFLTFRPAYKIKERRAVFDEALSALTELLTKDPSSFSGKYYGFSEVGFYPKPKQNPFPIYLGGTGKAVILKLPKRANGWLPAGLSPQEYKELRDQIRANCIEIGRDPQELEYCLQTNSYVGSSVEQAVSAYKETQLFIHQQDLRRERNRPPLVDPTPRALIGSVDDIIKKVEEYEHAGVQNLAATIFGAKTFDELEKSIVAFGRGVIPSFR